MPPYPPPNQHGENITSPIATINGFIAPQMNNEAGDQPAIGNWVIAPHIGGDKGRCASAPTGSRSRAAPVVSFPDELKRELKA